MRSHYRTLGVSGFFFGILEHSLGILTGVQTFEPHSNDSIPARYIFDCIGNFGSQVDVHHERRHSTETHNLQLFSTWRVNAIIGGITSDPTKPFTLDPAKPYEMSNVAFTAAPPSAGICCRNGLSP